jgi:hypothetical protein
MSLLINYGIRASAGGKDFIEPGLIVMWYGTAQTVPDGWALCDGINGTPELSDKFVIGAGDIYGVKSIGGNKDSILVSHNHTGATNSVTHTHIITNFQFTQDANSPVGGVGTTVSPFSGAGGHTHTFSLNSSGSGSATNSNLPPYYSLLYIIKEA